MFDVFGAVEQRDGFMLVYDFFELGKCRVFVYGSAIFFLECFPFGRVMVEPFSELVIGCNFL